MSIHYKLSKSKRIQAAIVVAIVALLVMTGTFAWYSFNQQKINTFTITVVPNVNLHDDFAGGPEKDIYVENSGVQPVLVRVRLTELLIQNGVLLPDGASDDEVGTNWHTHTALENICEVCEFKAHEYFKWTMSGQKFYMPAPESAKGFKIDDDTYTEPKAVGDLDAVIDYAALLHAAFASDSLLLSYMDEYLGGDATHAPELQTAIKAIPDDNTVSGVRQYDGQPEEELVRKLNEVRLTLIPKQIITMWDWLDGGCVTGDFWVVDADGWCYWANTLDAGEATGQLLSSVYNINDFSGELIYKINVVLNATTFSDNDLGVFFTTANANGGVTEDGMLLMFMASGEYVVGEDEELYKNDGGGAYRRVEKYNDSYMEYSMSATIYAGPDGIPGNGDDLKVGDTFSIDGNGGITDGGGYTIEGFTLGENGIVYFNVGNGVYIVSVDQSGNPDTDGTRYTPVLAGEDGKIGTEDDTRYYAENYRERFFYHIGSGVYVEVEDENGTASYTDLTDFTDEATTYYFSRTIFSENPLHIINNMNGGTVDDHVKAAFFETLQIGEFFGFYRSPGTDMCIVYKGEELVYHQTVVKDLARTFTMKQLYYHEKDGKLYFEVTYKQGDDSQIHDAGQGHNYTDYLNYYIKGLGDKGEFGGQYFGVRVTYDEVADDMSKPTLSAPMGEGTSEDPYQLWDRSVLEWITASVATGETFEGDYFKVGNDFSMYVVDNNNTPDDDSDDVSFNPDFAPIGDNDHPFLGHFDGAGFTISDLTINRTDSCAGLFGYIGAGGTVENVTLKDADVSGNNQVGGIAGYNAGTVSNCTITGGTVTGTGECTGGVVGYNNGSGAAVSRSYNTGGVTGNGNVGGVVGQNTGTVQDCSNTGAVTGKGNNTGGVIGYASGIIERCSNSGDVTGADTSFTTGGGGTGGVAGFSSGSYIRYTFNTGAVSGTSRVGGVVGGSYGRLYNSYAWCDVTGTGGSVGGVMGYASWGSSHVLQNSYHAKGKVTGQSSVGGVIGSYIASTTPITCVALSDKLVATDGLSVNKIAGSSMGGTHYSYSLMDVVPNGGTAGTPVDTKTPDWSWWVKTAKFPVDVWTIDSTPGSLPVFKWEYPGLEPPILPGSEVNPYLITNQAELQALNNAQAGEFYKVANDITLNTSFTPITAFKATLDGDGFAIKNLTLTGTTASDYNRGLFATINSGATVKNVTLSGVNIRGYYNVGSLAGTNLGTIENCHASGSVSGTYQTVGGIVGDNYGKVTKSSSTCQVNAYSGTVSNTHGGIAGYNNGSGEVSQCYRGDGGVYGELVVGGVAAYNKGNIDNCYATGAVQGSSNGNVGGVVGQQNDSGTLTKSFHAGGAVQGPNAASGTGGVVGGNFTSCKITDCVALATSISGTNRGNITYSNYGTVSNCFRASNLNDTNGVTGTQIAANAEKTQAFWENTSPNGPGFDFTTIWEWDGTNSRPKLKGVTP